MENKNETNYDHSLLLNMADIDPIGVIEQTSTLLASDKTFESDEIVRSARFVAYTNIMMSAFESNNNKINDEIIDLIEKALVEVKGADDASKEKETDYFGRQEVNFCAKVIEEVKPGRVQELWGKTRLYYFGNRVSMETGVVLTDDEILEEFGNLFFTFPLAVKYALIINPSNHEFVTVHLYGEKHKDSKGQIRIFRDGTVKVDEVFNYDKSINQTGQDSMTESKENNLGKEVENGSEVEWINKAGGFAKTENYRDALDCFEKVLELNPQNTVALIGKGYMLDKTGEKDKGMEYLERGLRVEQSLGESGSQYVKDDLARYHMNIAKTAWDKGLSNKSIQELEQAIKYEPSVDLKVFLTEACATYITLKLEIVKRAKSSNDKDLTDDEYNELQKALEMYDTVISLYESLSDDDILKSNLPLHESYAQAKRNSVAFGYFGLFIHDKNGNVTTRISDKTFINKKNKTNKIKKLTEEEIREKRQTLESEIKDLKQDRSKKYSEAGKIAYSKYKNNEPNFTGVSDIRIKWYAILAIDSEINKINQEIEALNSKEKKSGFFAQMGDLISKTAKQGKSKIDLYTIGNKKNNALTEFGEQLYFDNKNGILKLEELSNIWQRVRELEKEIEGKENEKSHL